MKNKEEFNEVVRGIIGALTATDNTIICRNAFCHYMRNILTCKELWTEYNGISEKAQQLLDSIGYTKDLSKLTAGPIPANKVLKEKGKNILIKEHYMPNQTIIDKLLQLQKDKKLTKAAVTDLVKDIKINIITKEEDDGLTSLGHAQDRPNPAKAYKEAQIKIIPFKKG